ncbi:MAG: MATE family efflux transporter [Acidobacteria bacterium]|nr:MATE family efflux transporter [Acidobacteriota bacterium]MBK9528034.1 MATE family efflux transporter [Acidobacteriota bacterium]MBP7474411.1 MATE family efflux transporter [Pyrinomonadaceae bacterium]MBP9109834.1 MATE family efflux transporter [Pyrinomonadaceae bacterium]
MSLNTESTPVEATPHTFASVLREAFIGTTRDFTSGPILPALIILAIPMILEMSMEALFAIVDTFFVAKLGAEPVAVVGFTESVLALVYAVAIGLSIGATATVARRFGEQDLDGAARTATHVVYLGVIVSVVMGAAGLIFAADILRLLGAEPSVIELGTPFARIMFGTNIVIVFLFLLNGVFRGAGDAAIALRVLIVANGLNIILDPLFIFGIGFFPELGVTGAAVATVIGRAVGVLYAFWALFLRKNGRLNVRAEHWRFDPKLIVSLVKISGTAVLQFLIATLSWSGLVMILAPFGTVALAGYQIGLRVIIFVLLPAVGLANAAATLVGQNLGAGKPERAERSVWLAGALNAGLLGLAGLFFVIFPDLVVSIFTTDPAVSTYASDCLRIVGYGYAFYGLGMVMESSFNGAGDTWTPTYLNFFVFWMFEIPLAYVLANHNGFGPQGVFWSMTLAFSMLAIVSALLFKRGKWKLKEV